MILFILAYLGGVLTIVSPCILPVLPFIFTRVDRPFLTSGLPMLAGMALMFAGVATLAAVGGGWAVTANQYGRMAALVLLALFGLTLLLPALADRAMQPLVALGARLSERAGTSGAGPWPSLLLGIATGLLWAPCAGPILGLVLTGAALRGANVGTSLLLLAYALGAVTSLGLALLAGGRLFARMKRSIGLGQWLRRALGAAVLLAVAAIALGLDTGFLSQASIAGTNRVEQALLDHVRKQADGAKPAPLPAPQAAMPTEAGEPEPAPAASSEAPPDALPASPPAEKLRDEGPMPALDGAVTWLNSPPLGREALKGKVVVIDFWTYSCINCLRALPYIKAWAAKYGKDGLVVIGVHAPEFAFEKDLANVRKAVRDLGVTYPVAVDNDYEIWRAFDNEYWPAHYFFDAQGRMRHHHYGEGDYAASERVIQQLLAEAHPGQSFAGTVTDRGKGAQAAASTSVDSPETYIGYRRAENAVTQPNAVHDEQASYEAHPAARNEWGLSGRWTIGAEHATLEQPGGRILFRFHARDLHLVLGAGAKDRPIRFRVTIDGHAPGADHGTDTDAAGNGMVDGQRLYQLVRLRRPGADHDFTITFLDPGVEAFSFTFG